MSDPTLTLRAQPVAPCPPRSVPPPGAAMLEALAANAPFPEVLRVEDVDLDVLRAVKRSFFSSMWHFIASVSEWLFGAFALVLGLAILSAIPIVQFLSLGYLLEVTGRVARSGRLRDGFVGVRRAARVGSIGLGLGLMYLVLWVPSSLALSAQIIDPGGDTARGWEVGLTVLLGLVSIHTLAACSRGGKLRYFFWPFNFIWLLRRLWRGGYYAEARDAVWNFVVSLRLPYYFWLGARGFAGVMAWVAVPIFLLSLGLKAPVVGFLGSFMLMAVLLYVPFLQTRFARDNRFRAFFEWRAVRADFRKAPVAFAFSLFLTLLFALPLYLLKIELIPRETMFLETLVFIAFMFPARLLMGWAYGRAGKRRLPRHWFLRWSARLATVPTVFLYVFLVFFTQHLAWGGVSSLYEQHAFLLPAPFLGWSK